MAESNSLNHCSPLFRMIRHSQDCTHKHCWYRTNSVSYYSPSLEYKRHQFLCQHQYKQVQNHTCMRSRRAYFESRFHVNIGEHKFSYSGIDLDTAGSKSNKQKRYCRRLSSVVMIYRRFVKFRTREKIIKII